MQDLIFPGRLDTGFLFRGLPIRFFFFLSSFFLGCAHFAFMWESLYRGESFYCGENFCDRENWKGLGYTCK